MGGHGSGVGNAPAACHGAGFPPSPVRFNDTYRVRYGRGGTWYVMEHRDGRVEVYARLVGLMAEERAEGIAEAMNENHRGEV